LGVMLRMTITSEGWVGTSLDDMAYRYAESPPNEMRPTRRLLLRIDDCKGAVSLVPGLMRTKELCCCRWLDGWVADVERGR